MPRLILEDDDGRELFRGQVSQENVETVARFLQRNMGSLRSLVAFKQAVEQVGEFLSPILDGKPPARRPPPLKPPARARGGRR